MEQVRQLSTEREQLNNTINEKEKENYELQSEQFVILTEMYSVDHQVIDDAFVDDKTCMNIFVGRT